MRHALRLAVLVMSPAAMLSLLQPIHAPSARRASRVACAALGPLALGLASGAKLMLLFRGTHHRQQEGAAAVAGGASTLADLRSRVERQRRQIEKRLASGAEALASLGALDGECEALAQDLRNAAVAPGAYAAASREAQLAELASIVALLADARAAEAKASLWR